MDCQVPILMYWFKVSPYIFDILCHGIWGYLPQYHTMLLSVLYIMSMVCNDIYMYLITCTYSNQSITSNPINVIYQNMSSFYSRMIYLVYRDQMRQKKKLQRRRKKRKRNLIHLNSLSRACHVLQPKNNKAVCRKILYTYHMLRSWVRYIDTRLYKYYTVNSIKPRPAPNRRQSLIKTNFTIFISPSFRIQNIFLTVLKWNPNCLSVLLVTFKEKSQVIVITRLFLYKNFYEANYTKRCQFEILADNNKGHF